MTYADRTVEVEDAVRRLKGPGKLLGYRRSCVYSNVRCTLLYDPDALAENNLRRRKAKGNFTSRGPNWVHSLDGHDKLIGYQNSTLPIAVYGCIDTCNQKMLWVKVWVYLYQARTMSSKLRLDKGSETGEMALMYSFLDSIMGTWIQWRQSYMGHQLPIRYVYFFM